MKKKIGTRGSKLALWQANFVKKRLEGIFPDIDVELVVIKTKGDRILDTSLSEIGGKGLFIKEIEDSLIRGEIDLAVHSLKDMTTQIPAELTLAAVSEREDVRDCIITADGKSLNELEKQTVIGTSSLRRKSQVLNIRPDLEIKMLRGNLDTRLKKLYRGEYGGIIAAAAGLNRLDFEEKITQFLSPDIFIPAVGQGALGIETRADDQDTIEIVKELNHGITSDCVSCERAFLERLEGSCKAPIAANAVFENDKISIVGMVASIDGNTMIKNSMRGNRKDAVKIGFELGESLYNKGADKILKEILGEQ